MSGGLAPTSVKLAACKLFIAMDMEEVGLNEFPD